MAADYQIGSHETKEPMDRGTPPARHSVAPIRGGPPSQISLKDVPRLIRSHDFHARPLESGPTRTVGGSFSEIRAAKENAMAEHATPATCGVDHVGLSVRDLESIRCFFCTCLGWRVVGERPEYPAAFVLDGQQIVTLWRVEAPDQRSRSTGAPTSAFII
jgi:hypothetical protein